MPGTKRIRTPSYRLHKPSGLAVVRLNGRDHYLGKHGTEESWREYRRLIAEWFAARHQRPEAAADGHGRRSVTVDELLTAYWEHARDRHRARRSGGLEKVRSVMGPLHELYGQRPAEEFGPLALKTVRDRLNDGGRACRTLNEYAGLIKQIFRWGVEHELVPAHVHEALRAVSGLRESDAQAPLSEPVDPAPEHQVEAVLPLVSPAVRAMIELQRLTGMRPGEVVIMRGCDLDIGGRTWVYTPAHHKNAHRGQTRRIYLGPKAQRTLEPWLKTDLSAYLFSPVECEAARQARRAERRKTPPRRGNFSGTNRRRSPKRGPGQRYTVDSYRRAIQRACDLAFPPPKRLARQQVPGKRGTRWETDAEWRKRLGPKQWEKLKAWRNEHRWHPNQLRHNAATYLRKRYGLEAARVVLGHNSAAVTEVYAELDFAKAEQIMGEVG